MKTKNLYRKHRHVKNKQYPFLSTKFEISALKNTTTIKLEKISVLTKIILHMPISKLPNNARNASIQKHLNNIVNDTPIAFEHILSYTRIRLLKFKIHPRRSSLTSK